MECLSLMLREEIQKVNTSAHFQFQHTDGAVIPSDKYRLMLVLVGVVTTRVGIGISIDGVLGFGVGMDHQVF